LIDITGLRLAFGERVIFGGKAPVNWRIADDAKVGLVGDNGAGKTTLLRVILGEVEPDEGRVERSKNLTISCLPQDLAEIGDAPLLEFLKRRVGIAKVEERIRAVEREMERSNAPLPQLLAEHARLERRFELLGGFGFDSDAAKVLNGLGFRPSDAEKSCAAFSGGWKMRITLAALLLSRPDVLLLDEPTNHLDTESMEWLESWLRGHQGALVAVSHDRRFLDNATNSTAELSRGKLTLYPWSYERYAEEKESEGKRLEKAVAEQMKRVDEMERFISRFRYKATKAAQVQSRVKQLEKMDRLELENPSKAVRFRIPEAPDSGWEVLRAAGLSKSYAGTPVFEGVDLTVHRGERVALVGVNGAGKSTLLRLLSEAEPPTSGFVKIGHNVRRSFYSQESAANLDYSKTVKGEAFTAPSRLNEAERRNLLGAFLFSGDDIEKPVSVLSGGEKARLALFKLMLSESNLLILDEPTNHLDMKTREMFQTALLRYGGTLIIVSHDRHFLDTLADRVIEIRNGVLYDYPGNYSWFLEKREEQSSEKPDAKASGGTPKKHSASRPAAPSADRLKLEARIENSEARRGEIDALLCLPETLSDSALVRSLMVERAQLEKDIAADYAVWENM
jgi:ATP-binding cassette subfamily F protein 3